MFEELNEIDKNIATIIYENSGGEKLLTEAPTASGSSYVPQVVVPLIEYVQKELVSKELVDVQPIIFKKGKIFSLNIKDDAGNVVSGIDAVGTFNDAFSEIAEGTNLNELVLELKETEANVKTRKVKLSYTAELTQDLKVLKYNLEKSKLGILGSEIASGIDYDIIEAIIAHSDYHTPIVYTWDNNKTETLANPLRELQIDIFTAAGNIAAATRKGLADFIIVGTIMQPVISTMLAYTADLNPKLSPLAKIGKLGYLDVYVNTFDTTTMDMYVGKKPVEGFGSGITFSPYRIEASDPVIDAEDFTLNQAIFSRYAITKQTGGNTFYHKVSVGGTPTNFPF